MSLLITRKTSYSSSNKSMRSVPVHHLTSLAKRKRSCLDSATRPLPPSHCPHNLHLPSTTLLPLTHPPSSCTLYSPATLPPTLPTMPPNHATYQLLSHCSFSSIITLTLPCWPLGSITMSTTCSRSDATVYQAATLPNQMMSNPPDPLPGWYITSLSCTVHMHYH